MNIKTTALAIMTSMITINATAQSNAPQLRADNIDEVIIDSGFHSKEDVYMNVSEESGENE